jgi:hypothetical protein
MRCEVAHSIRGRLRIRYPATWLRAQGEGLETAIRALTGVRTVSHSPVTGSVRVDYDPVHLTADDLLAAIERMAAPLLP